MRKVILACGILIGAIVLIFGLLIFKYRFFVGSFLSPAKEKINILVLGKGGVGHEAPDLTDTIFFVSVTENKIAAISLPRDIWVPDIRAKLNSAYYYGGTSLAKSTAEKITGQLVEYGLVIDFSGFKKVIDALGGIEIEVKNSFVDEKYPIAGKEADPCLPCRYETLRFTQGKQLMDGETALKFVRSRNSEGPEGTDLARGARQQIVIVAIKEAVSDPAILFNLMKLKLLARAISESVETDIDQRTFGTLFKYAFGVKNSIEANIIPTEFLFKPPVSKRYDNQYVFVPKSGNWSEVQRWITSFSQ